MSKEKKIKTLIKDNEIGVIKEEWKNIKKGDFKEICFTLPEKDVYLVIKEFEDLKKGTLIINNYEKEGYTFFNKFGERIMVFHLSIIPNTLDKFHIELLEELKIIKKIK